MSESTSNSPTSVLAVSSMMSSMGNVNESTGAETPRAEDNSPWVPLPSDEEAWQLLPPVVQGGEQALPSWVRILAQELPRSAAAFLELDIAQRTKSPVAPVLRAGMRWVAAHANHCHYAETYAIADAIRMGIDDARIEGLNQEDYHGWSPEEQTALKFALRMTVDSDSVTDHEFAGLIKRFGEKTAAAMVLLMAYSNFQDRFLLCVNAPLEEGGPVPPVNVTFSPDSYIVETTRPPAFKKLLLPMPTGSDLVDVDPGWTTLSYETLQERLEAQRQKPTRLRIPSWDEVIANLPEGLMKRPSDIVWYRIAFGYAPELAVPFEILMRTAGAEASPKWERIFGQGLFWVTTQAVKCPYCMGHCEMNWEVAGLSVAEIAERSRLLASNDWSSFSPADQRAFAFARKLSKTPGDISRNDVEGLIGDFGLDRAIIVMLNASRYHYMTRISNGFQLTLERENVFYEYYNVPSPSTTGSSRDVTSATVLSADDCWSRMPRAVAGEGQALPIWARAVATHLPRTAAAMLRLDFAHRTQSPLDPVLRGKMRWVIAHANRCEYSEAYALADLERAGLDVVARQTLTGDSSSWPGADREALEFARQLTVSAPQIPDELFERIRAHYGNKQIAAMVLLAAYGNFQDRIVLGLNLSLEENGPLPPLDITFAEDAFQLAPLTPPQNSVVRLRESGDTVVPEDDEWSRISYEELQSRLEGQRDRQPRIPIPAWEDVQKNLPAAMAARSTRIIWNLVCSGYVPELAVPWSISTRTMWAESQSDRIFEESLFWIQTRSIECNYCMGHCEMLLEVAGLDKNAVAERTRRLASPNWSAFPPEEQRAFDYARKLSKAPWDLTVGDFRSLEFDLGPEKAMATFWWLCRGLYMTRVSDGFQLPLERENVFQDSMAGNPDAISQATKPKPR